MKTINQVYQTNDYDRFSLLKGNRVVNRLHIERLKKSFKESYLLAPILVNEKYEIIDGQHRFHAARDLDLPINFIIEPNYSLREVQLLNSNMKNWKKIDYLNAFCDLGYQEYLKMRDFMEEFPDFGISAAEAFLTNNSGGANNKVKEKIDGKEVSNAKLFEYGGLVIDDLSLAYENASKVMQIKPYYEGYNRTIFVGAMLHLFRNKHYDHSQMIARLKSNPGMIDHRTNITQYKLLLEQIYNFRSRNKVSLRFS